MVTASGVKRFLLTWLINTFAVLVAACLLKGIHYQSPLALVIATLLLGIFNTFLRPALLLLALPLLLVTLGLFTLVINALLLFFVGSLLKPHFYVDGFWTAFWGALIISIVSAFLNALTRTPQSRVSFQVRRRPPPSDPGDGPIIDV